MTEDLWVRMDEDESEGPTALTFGPWAWRRVPFGEAVERMVDQERRTVSEHRERNGLPPLVEPGWTVSARVGMRALLRAAVERSDDE